MQSSDQCREMELLIQADIDGELSAAEVARVAAHRMACSHCEQVHQQLLELRHALKAELKRHTAPADLRAKLQLAIAAESKPASITVLSPVRQKSNAYKRSLTTFGAGAALAATLVLFMLSPAQQPLLDAVVAEHIRSLQPGHLLDVESNDQHNVKPWFDGRLDFSPPVRNFSAQGFPLVGGRLDYLNGREVAALIYQRGKHAINVFVWPDNAAKPVLTDSDFKTHNGYNAYQWKQAGMIFWVVSDLNREELNEFVKLWSSTTL